jgi:pre-mRNA-splicing helicase BRR2
MENETENFDEGMEKDQEAEKNYSDGLSVLRTNISEVSTVGEGENNELDVREIDAYWLQRQISRAFEGTLDADQNQKLSEEVYEMLSSAQAKSFREVYSSVVFVTFLYNRRIVL